MRVTHLLVDPGGDVDGAAVVIVLLVPLRARRGRPRPVRRRPGRLNPATHDACNEFSSKTAFFTF